MAKSKSFLEGYILPEKDRVRDEAASGDDSEGDGDEDATTEFLDMEMSNSSSDTAWVDQSSMPSRRKVLFKTFRGDELTVTGRFSLSAPWWHIACHTQGGKHNLTVQGSAWYKVRTDLDKDGWRPVVSLFLVACGVPQESIQRFFEWLPNEQLVTIGNLLEVLTGFEENSDSDLAQNMNISKMVSASADGRRVRASFSYPRVMQYLPVLLPRQFEALLSPPKDANRDHVDRLLAQLEDIIKKDVWKLGFSEVMSKELKLVRCEAQRKVFEDCGLLKEMPCLQRNALWVYDEVKRHCANTGSTYMEEVKLRERLRKVTGIPETQVWEALSFLRAQGVMMLDKRKVVLQKLHEYESGIADSLRHLVDAEQWTIPINAEEVLYAYAQESRRAKTEKDPTMDLSALSPAKVDQLQLQAAEMICSNPVTVINGKGGCGKTTVVSLLFRAAVKKGRSASKESAAAFADAEDPGEDPGEHKKGPFLGDEPGEGPRGGGQSGYSVPDDKLLEEHILLTAPTGRAASLLTKKTGFKAFTLHQSVRVLVLDEGSLVPIGLLHAVLSRLIDHGKLQKFIMLGDERQLPSIQPGNTLTDLFYSLKVVNHTVEMKTNHRSESELIVKNAQKIADKEDIKFDHVVNLPGPFNIPLDRKFIHIRLPDNKNEGDDDLQQAVKWLISSAPGLDDHSKSQFIAFRRVDVDLINELCCTHYNQHTTKDYKRKLKFQPGDKVCVTKNGFIDQEDAEALEKDDGDGEEKMDHTEMGGQGQGKRVLTLKARYAEKMETQRNPDDDDEKEEKIRLCNGEIFFITEDHTELGGRGRGKRVVTLDDRLGCTVKAQYRALMRGCKLRHAWARTIHTFQGSESETVVYVVGPNGYQTWRHVYTAVTRGQKRVYVVSTDATLQGALKRRETPRLTRLEGLVKEQVVQLVQASPQLQRDHRGSPKFTSQMSTPQKSTPQRSTPQSSTPQSSTPQRSTPQVPPRQTPGSKAIVPKRLLGAGGPVEGAPESGSPPRKKNKVSERCVSHRSSN